MSIQPATDLESEFVPSHGGEFMSRYGPAGRSATYSKKKVCFVATDKQYLVASCTIYRMRDDCYYVKYSCAARDGMYLGRCFLTSDSAAGRLCQEFKAHPKLMVSIQDDEFFEAYRDGEPGLTPS